MCFYCIFICRISSNVLQIFDTPLFVLQYSFYEPSAQAEVLQWGVVQHPPSVCPSVNLFLSVCLSVDLLTLPRQIYTMTDRKLTLGLQTPQRMSLSHPHLGHNDLLYGFIQQSSLLQCIPMETRDAYIIIDFHNINSFNSELSGSMLTT